MMKLDYGTQLSPSPITLSIGTIKKPTLKEIAQISFDLFSYYQIILKMTPENFYTKIKGEEGKKYWISLSEEDKKNISLFDIINKENDLREIFNKLLDFFFLESVIYYAEPNGEGYFILLNQGVEDEHEITHHNIKGVISKENFPQIIDIIQQICCITSKEDNIEEQKFKNNIAKKMYEKMLKAKKKKQEEKKTDINLTIPNIISAVSSMHPSINLINVWDLTIFQLLDKFNRLQTNTIFGIDAKRVSVWGDEKKTFDITLWYKNEYDKK